MNHTCKTLPILLVILLIGCSPKVITNTVESTLPSRANLYYEPFAIIEKNTIDRTLHQPIGQIEIKDGGLTLQCDYETIKKLAKEEALKVGGNCYVITEHRKPSQWSTCHRIKADVFLIDNAKDYENEVVWHKKRKLEISDFKASTNKRPFTAVTTSGFRYRVEGRPAFPNKYKLFVETYFDCQLSYFKRTEFDSLVLAHEQIHFDISELYARKFVEQMEKKAKNLDQLLANRETIFRQVWNERQIKQDAYDTEVYADRSKQADWDQWIKEELRKYDSFEEKILIIEKGK